MSWVTPITDRTQDDIDNLTSKGYFNISDWTRIDGNITVIKTMLDNNNYLDIPLNSLTAPTVTTIPEVTDINDLVENIVFLQQSACISSSLLATLKYDYQSGANAIVPDFEDVNDWESNLLILYEAIPNAVTYRCRCGVFGSGQSRLWQNRFRR
jgi:hypothetical protein